MVLMGRNQNVLLARYVGSVCWFRHKMTTYRDERDIHCEGEPLMVHTAKAHKIHKLEVNIPYLLVKKKLHINTPKNS